MKKNKKAAIWRKCIGTIFLIVMGFGFCAGQVMNTETEFAMAFGENGADFQKKYQLESETESESE
ncbi:MAG: hypothetical protein Q4C61_16435, partial [Lachnospiraceae bacterium]|nr:hypothetical protein [Lachnospiraceae bacterium]